MTTSDDSTRDSTGTKIGEAGGAAVRAARSAGDWIRLPATHPMIELSMTAAITAAATFLLLIVRSVSLDA